MSMNQAEALERFVSDDLIAVAMQADATRRRMHPEGVVAYTVAAAVRCGDPARTCAEAVAAVERGASTVCLRGAGRLGLASVTELLAELRRELPEIWLEALRPEEVSALAAAAGQDMPDLLSRLRDAGLDSLLPEGPPPRDVAEVDAWFDLHAAAHRAGMPTVAILSFGAGESLESRVAFMARVEALQQRTGGFAAFSAEPAAAGLDGPTAVDSLKTLAIGRLMLASIEHVRVTQRQGLKVLETGLRFGADDAGQLLLPGDGRPDLREEDLRRVIRDAGLRPVERCRGYSALFAI